MDIDTDFHALLNKDPGPTDPDLYIVFLYFRDM